MTKAAYQRAIEVLKKGGIIAYPTEAVYGVGCDPRNETALKKLIEMKGRDERKGMLLIASTFDALLPYLNLNLVSPSQLASAIATWPGPHTWVFPAHSHLSDLITGHRSTVGVRVSAFPAVVKLCQQWQGALVSTSCNLSNTPPLTAYEEVMQTFAQQIDYIVPGRVGDLGAPTPIREVLTGERLR